MGSLKLHFKVTVSSECKQVIPSQMFWALSVWCDCKMHWATVLYTVCLSASLPYAINTKK